MYCSRCGVKIPEDAKFCQNCGAQIYSQEKQGKIDKRIEESEYSIETEKDELIEKAEEDKWGNILHIISLVCLWSFTAVLAIIVISLAFFPVGAFQFTINHHQYNVATLIYEKVLTPTQRDEAQKWIYQQGLLYFISLFQ